VTDPQGPPRTRAERLAMPLARIVVKDLAAVYPPCAERARLLRAA
jgi:hypothetical protein